MEEERRTGSRGWKAFWVLMFLVLVALALVIWCWEDITQRMCGPLVEEQEAICASKIASLRHPMPPPPPVFPPELPREEARRWTELTGTYPKWPEDLLSPRSCTEIEEDLKAVCSEMDRRPYLQGRLPSGGTFTVLREVVRALHARTPVASGEMQRPEAVVANVFHLFRVMGGQRLSLIKEIMESEAMISEPLALTIYRWLIAQERCWKDTQAISRAALEDYAAFLLNTFGGQGYLRRRPPKVAALASFYAVITLDEASRRGSNPHGVDLRPHIRFCKELVASQDLLFRDRYLEILNELEQRWKAVSPRPPAP